MKYIFNLKNDSEIIQELETRKLLAYWSTNFTAEEYLEYENHGIPQLDNKYLIGGNMIFITKKNGKTDLTPKDVLNSHVSVRRHLGTLFHTTVKVYKLTDSELCWRY